MTSFLWLPWHHPSLRKTLLISKGYKKVKAIGLPILYVKKDKVQRISNSLLIVPKHSLTEINEEWDNEKDAV